MLLIMEKGRSTTVLDVAFAERHFSASQIENDKLLGMSLADPEATEQKKF